MAIGDALEIDIRWREAELAVFKTTTAATSIGEPKGRSLRRAYLALLYAHYEGFTKFALESYIIQISKTSHNVCDLADCLQLIFRHSEVKALRSAPLGDFIARSKELLESLENANKLSYDQPETSNLWPSVFRDMCNGVGLRSDYLDPHWQDLRSLVSRRNDVAHGKKVEVDDLSLHRLETAVWNVIFELAVDVVECFEDQKYIKNKPHATIGI